MLRQLAVFEATVRFIVGGKPIAVIAPCAGGIPPLEDTEFALMLRRLAVFETTVWQLI